MKGRIRDNGAQVRGRATELFQVLQVLLPLDSDTHDAIVDNRGPLERREIDRHGVGRYRPVISQRRAPLAHQVRLALGEFHGALRASGFALIATPDLQTISRYVVDDRLEDVFR